MRSCGACGRPLTAGRRPTARFCDATCRQRFARGQRPAVVIDLPAGESPAADGAEGAPLPTLEDVARALGAQLLDRATPANAKANLAKEYRATLAEIAKRAPRPRSVIDELAERRAQRTGS